MKGFMENLGVETAAPTIGKATFTLPKWLRDDKDPESNWFYDIGKYLIYLKSAKLLKEKGYIDLDVEWKNLTSSQVQIMVESMGESYGLNDKQIKDLITETLNMQVKYQKPFNENRGYVGIAFVKSNNDKDPLTGTYSFQDVTDKSKDTIQDGKTIPGKAFTGGKVKIKFNVCQFHDTVLGAAANEPKLTYSFYVPFVAKDRMELYLGRIHKTQVERDEGFSDQEQCFIISPELKFQEKYKNIDGQLNDLWC